MVLILCHKHIVIFLYRVACLSHFSFLDSLFVCRDGSDEEANLADKQLGPVHVQTFPRSKLMNNLLSFVFAKHISINI